MGDMQQGELPFEPLANLNYFQVYQAMVFSGDSSKMGQGPFALYCTIRAFANFRTGEILATLERLCQASGVTRNTIKKQIKTLEEMGYIKVEDRGLGKPLRFYTNDQIPVINTAELPTDIVAELRLPPPNDIIPPRKMLVSRYIPQRWHNTREQMTRYVSDGREPSPDKGPVTFNIQNLNVTINVNQGQTIKDVNASAVTIDNERELPKGIDVEKLRQYSLEAAVSMQEIDMKTATDLARRKRATSSG